MTFDWGGFSGGIIGTASAFGLALWTFRREEKKEEPVTWKKNTRFYYDIEM